MGKLVGWLITLAGVAAIIAGFVMNPDNWWYVGFGIGGVIGGLIVVAYNSESDFVPDLIDGIVDCLSWFFLLEWLDLD
jgi:uncharacterized membrane protein HdeD (DUF308 family)